MSLSIWFIGSSFLIVYFLRKRNLVQTLIFLFLIIFSYPSIFILATGNIEAWIGFLLILSSIFAYYGKWNSFAVCIGFAGAIKGVPLIFILLPLFIKKQSGIVIAIKTLTFSFMVSVFSLIVLPKGYLANGSSGFTSVFWEIWSAQATYRAHMENSISGVNYGHSLLNAVHALFGLQTLPTYTWGPVIFCILFVVLLICLYLQRVARVKIWLIYLSISVFACLALPTSTDYKLIYLAAPLLLAAKSDLSSKYEKLLLVLLVFTMSPKPYLYVGENPFSNASVFLTSASLLIIMVVCYLHAINSKLRQS